ncbi:Bug family tripartite tricarboxylate transporter substrate binding protein [Pseudochelatococcus lubricantis]|uniref:Bug family tripartite tricarboxylate transporter substrate binding protein n=1 Tax=Pseudochelatococcus lubricantis TaxID=1538102 RepID=UPI0035E91B90
MEIHARAAWQGGICGVLVATAMMLTAAFAAPAAMAQSAENYPQRPVRVIIPFAPGGSTDLVGRRLAEALGKKLGGSFYAENIAGADGAIGAGEVARARPDGYTLLYGNASALTIAPALKDNLRYNPVESFDAIGQIVTYPLIFAGNPGKPFKNFKEFLDYTKAHPGGVNVASSSTGAYMATAVLMLETGMDVQIIPYKGGGPAMIDMISGEVDAGFGSTGSTLPLVHNGQLRALAIAGHERHPDLPDVPTIAEAGYPAFEAGSWNGLLAPQGTSPEIIAKLSETIQAVLQDPEMIAFLKAQGMTPAKADPAAFEAYIKTETERWNSVVKSGRVKLPQ